MCNCCIVCSLFLPWSRRPLGLTNTADVRCAGAFTLKNLPQHHGSLCMCKCMVYACVCCFLRQMLVCPRTSVPQEPECSMASPMLVYVSSAMIFPDRRGPMHRPYSRQVTERVGCNVAIHPPPSIYPKAGNGALWDQWAIKYNCQNDSSIIAFTVRDLVHWNYVISQKHPTRVQVVEITVNLCFCSLHFFVHPTLSPLK